MPASLPAQAQQPASHTPGPWRWDGTNKQPKAFCYLDGPDYERVGVALDAFTDNAANARLIAAAPELLNMLQRMVDETSGGGTACLLTLEHAREALAQATQPSPSHE